MWCSHLLSSFFFVHKWPEINCYIFNVLCAITDDEGFHFCQFIWLWTCPLLKKDGAISSAELSELVKFSLAAETGERKWNWRHLIPMYALWHTQTHKRKYSSTGHEKTRPYVACQRCVGVCCDLCKSVYLDSNTSTLIVFVSISWADQPHLNPLITFQTFVTTERRCGCLCTYLH